MKIVEIGVLASLILAQQGTAQPNAGADAYPAFWRQFKTAVAARDVRAVKALTRFPFVVGFQDDQEHTRRVDATRFETYSER